ncbi:hypothetical protein K439DRAFT_1636229 [Ramaria rubella]|nr:hypothetical protein K439DRAFT_1636229 [Ramaria rubella]
MLASCLRSRFASSSFLANLTTHQTPSATARKTSPNAPPPNQCLIVGFPVPPLLWQHGYTASDDETCLRILFDGRS